METTFKTRLEKGATATTTTAQVDWSGVSTEEVQGLAMRTIIIMMQAIYRTAGKVPSEDTIKVANILKRERTGVKLDTPEARAAAFTRLTAKMTPAELAQLANQLRGSVK